MDVWEEVRSQDGDGLWTGKRRDEGLVLCSHQTDSGTFQSYSPMDT
jgi:hypothetical protein